MEQDNIPDSYPYPITYGEMKNIAGLLDQFEVAAKKFIAKVDSGQARSTETYNELKSLVDSAEALRTEFDQNSEAMLLAARAA